MTNVITREADGNETTKQYPDKFAGTEHTNSNSVGALSSSQAFIVADQALTTAYVDLAGMSLTLDVGTWLVTAVIQGSPGGTNTLFARLYNSTAGSEIAGTAKADEAGHSFSSPITAIVELTESSVIKIQARHDASTMTVLRAVDNIPSTYMNAVKIS